MFSRLCIVCFIVQISPRPKIGRRVGFTVEAQKENVKTSFS